MCRLKYRFSVLITGNSWKKSIYFPKYIIITGNPFLKNRCFFTGFFLQGLPILGENLFINDIFQLVFAILHINATAILALTITLELLGYCNPSYISSISMSTLIVILFLLNYLCKCINSIGFKWSVYTL